jgi:hypothetical protein
VSWCVPMDVLGATFSQLGNFMNGCKNTLDLDINLTLCVVSKCSNRGQEVASEDTVERGWWGMWGGEEVAAVHTVKGGGG